VSQVELDLIDSDGVIQSVAACDAAVWSASGASLQGYASARGYAINEYDTPPDAGTASANLTSVTDVQQWVNGVALTAVGAATASPGTAGAGGAGSAPTGLLVALGLAGGVLVWLLWRR
jgi:hypothetical protein